MQGLNELIELSKKNVTKCPWCKEKTQETYFPLLMDEIKELKAAFKNNDLDNLEEELGDILWVTLTLIYICERDKKVDSDKVIKRVLEKFKSRKPWLLTGEPVSREEAGRIWEDAKKKEKGRKNKPA